MAFGIRTFIGASKPHGLQQTTKNDPVAPSEMEPWNYRQAIDRAPPR